MPTSPTAAYWIHHLALERHPEGGYFRETYRSPVTLLPEALPKDFTGQRSLATTIYFLLEGCDFSALHRLRSDETWHFYCGATLELHSIEPNGSCRTIHLGSRPERGETFQATIPAGAWFGATVADPGSYALLGCTVAPGFDFADFELAARSDLCRRFPRLRNFITRLTRA
jgi:hypothetical protein